MIGLETRDDRSRKYMRFPSFSNFTFILGAHQPSM